MKYYPAILHTKWQDNISPVITIAAETEDWTNCKDGIDINITAIDLGTGLDYIKVYRDDVLVKTVKGLNGIKEKSFIMNHTEEGVFRYKAIVFDKEGNQAEAYTNCRYDIKAPKEVTMNMTNDSIEQLENFDITVEVTDYNVQY